MTAKPDKIIYADVIDSEVGLFTGIEKAKTWFLDRDLKEQAKDCEDLSINGLAFHVENPKGGPYFIIFIKKEASVFTVSHEALHIAWYLLDFKGIQIDVDNHEILAYLQAFLAREVSLHLGLIKEVD